MYSDDFQSEESAADQSNENDLRSLYRAARNDETRLLR